MSRTRTAVILAAASAVLAGLTACGSGTPPPPKAPASCGQALDLAEQIVTVAGTAMGYASDAMGAASTFDAAGIDAASANIDSLNPKVQSLITQYKPLAAACRASS